MTTTQLTNQLDYTNRVLRYDAAHRLVEIVDDHLTRNTCHYRNKAGELLLTLDEVVNAILTNDLAEPEAE